MKLLLLFLLVISNFCAAVEVTWTAPTQRENGNALLPSELCCYEIVIRELATNKAIQTLTIPSTGAARYKYTFALPTVVNQDTALLQIAAIDTDGLYSKFVLVEKVKPLLAPTDGEVF